MNCPESDEEPLVFPFLYHYITDASLLIDIQFVPQ